MSTSPDLIPSEIESLASAETRMRHALGPAKDLHGGTRKPRTELQQPTPEARSSNRPSGERPRKRFVQDGDVPITIVNRQGHRGFGVLTVPPVSRIDMIQEPLANERAARERVERTLQEALTTIHDLQTKRGHAELARQEASESAQMEREATEALRTDYQEREARLNDELAAERSARIVVETALQKAILARDYAVRELRAALDKRSGAQPKLSPTKNSFSADAATVPATHLAKATREPKAAQRTREPQPVKWWLSPSKKQ